MSIFSSFMPGRKAPAWAAVCVAALGVGFSAGGGGSKPSAPQKPERLSDSKKDYCRILYGCGLEKPAGYCPDTATLGKPPFHWDSARCLEARLLQTRGVGPSHPLVGFQLYRFLGMEYRLIYDVTDTLPVSPARFEYLLNDLPTAAKLISHYREEPYTAEYLDVAHTYFKGTKGKRLRGEARLVSGSLGEKRLFYFGTGTAEIAFWTLKGPALLDFTYWPLEGKTPRIGYKMKLLVFPGSGLINSIMSLGLFKRMVYGKIREVLKDITETARKIADTGGKDLLQSPKWNPDDKKKIEAFLKLP